MIFPASFLPIVAFALRASRACQVSSKGSFETPLTPAAAQAASPEALSGENVAFVKVPFTQNKIRYRTFFIKNIFDNQEPILT